MATSIIAETLVNQKYQATIPPKVREQLDIHAGDKIVFERKEDDTIVVRKKVINPVDWQYLSALEGTLNEWNCAEDNDAYGDL